MRSRCSRCRGCATCSGNASGAWRAKRALQYIALVFAVDFIVEPLQAGGADKYPLSYLPFVATLFGGVALRLAAHATAAIGSR